MQREYRIDLRADLAAMTWRRFLVLVRGLSLGSATVSAMRAQHQPGRAKGAAVAVVGPKAAQRAFEAAFAPARRRKDH